MKKTIIRKFNRFISVSRKTVEKAKDSFLLLSKLIASMPETDVATGAKEFSSKGLSVAKNANNESEVSKH